MILYINNVKIDLPDGFTIARTKQVNEIGRLDNRQSNLTHKIKLPKTKNNIIAFRYLGEQGSTSLIPYQRNTAQLYNEVGECEIYNGWAVVENTNDYYEVVIYDGYVEFSKEIENKNLTDLGISELNHTKTLTNVQNSWLPGSNYKYILADYNGKVFYTNATVETLNIDYLVPSVSVAYLWNKIATFFGYTFSGSVFSLPEFTSLYMTFPKGLSNSALVPELFYTSTGFNTLSEFETNAYLSHVAPVTTLGSFLPNNSGLTIDRTGAYLFNTTGTILAELEDQYGTLYYDMVMSAYIVINPANTTSEPIVMTSLYDNTLLQLDSGDVIYLYVSYGGGQYVSIQNLDLTDLNVTYSFVEGDVIDFESALIDFKVKDFINEILWRFGLTPFKNKYNKSIEFLTFNEWFNNTEYVDLTDRFVRTINENYQYSNYAQNNLLKFKYNDDESDHKDGAITIDNVNLDETVSIINSKIYAPNKERSTIFTELFNVYPLWDKEANEKDGAIEVKYKSKDKRFYFLKSIDKVYTSFAIGSESLSDATTITNIPVESFTQMSFGDVVQNYYIPIYNVLNEFKIMTVELRLDDSFIANLDLRKRVYIKQLASWFVINKIPNYLRKGIYKIELIQVKNNG